MAIRTAREAFFKSQYRAEFERLAATNAFDTACEYALLTFIEELTPDDNPNNGWGRDSQRVGAQRVLAILRELHLPVEPPAQYKATQLKPPK